MKEKVKCESGGLEYVRVCTKRDRVGGRPVAGDWLYYDSPKRKTDCYLVVGRRP